MAIQTVIPQTQGQQSQQAFTAQIPTSRIAEALISQGVGGQARAPDFSVATQQILEALSEKKDKKKRKKEDEAFLSDLAEALRAPSAPGPEAFLPGAAGLGPVTSQDLPPIPSGLDPSQPLNREAAALAEERLRNTRFNNLGGR